MKREVNRNPSRPAKNARKQKKYKVTNIVGLIVYGNNILDGEVRDGAGGIVALTELLNLPPPKPSFNKDPKIGPTMNATHAPMSLKAYAKPDDFMPSR
jgi:hypothetical protein